MPWYLTYDNQYKFHYVSGVSDLLSRSILRSLTQWQRHIPKDIPLKLNFWTTFLHEKQESRVEMWAGFQHTNVMLPHAAFLRRTSSLCCPHSRHVHSWHSCPKFQEQLTISPSAGLCLSLLRPPLHCCLETKASKNGDNGERGRGGPYQKRMKEERDQRGGQAGRGVMKFVWDTLDFYSHCVVPISSPYSPAPS